MLRDVLGLEPLWWLAWIAPAPLLALALRSSRLDACWITALAALIGLSGNLRYLNLVMPAPAALLVLAAQALLWVFVVAATRRVVLRYRAWWSVFAYPVFWVAADQLMAGLAADGNWGSLAYSQSEFLPLLQVGALFGVPGVLFLLALAPSALALGVVFGGTLRRARWSYGISAALLGAALVYGGWRLQPPAAGQPTRFGMVAIDDGIEPRTAPDKAAAIWDQYQRHVEALAARGASVIVLPERMAVLTPAQAPAVQARFSALARRSGSWIEAGVELDDGKGRRNLAWLFGPDGALAAHYQKHYLAPSERAGFVAGAAFEVRRIGGHAYGLAICKDMHFADLGRAYGARQAAVMLVPAWDFGLDRWLGARMTATRGVENGYAVVRSAREGLLTASDAYGRILGERRSGPMPGAALLVDVALAAPLPTLYTRIGDLLGWICVGAAAMLLVLGRRARIERG